MARVINLADKLSNERPKIAIFGKEYEVNNSLAVVLKFEELFANVTIESMKEAIKLTLGENAANELNLENFSLNDFKVLMTAIIAAIQDIEYEEAEKLFRESEQKFK